MKGGHWVMYTYETGEVGEKLKFYVPDESTERIAKRERDALKKVKQNLRSATRKLARYINNNFFNGDLLIGLDYSDQGLEKILTWGRANDLPVDSEDEEIRRNAIWEAADHELNNLLRRVIRELKKEGIELKYAGAITSDMDPDTKEYVRVHHHLVVNKEAKEAFLKKWKKMGRVDYEYLWSNQKDRTWIAEYFMAQVRQIRNAKKFSCSRNLILPKPKKRICLSDALIRVPKNAKLLYLSEYAPGEAQYIRYELPPKYGKSATVPDGRDLE